MNDRSISPGLQFVRFSVWLMVAIGTAFFVPQYGFKTLMNSGSSEFLSALFGVPLLLAVSVLPIAAVVEIVIARRRGYVVRTATLVKYAFVSTLLVAFWGYGEPYLYFGLLHPAELTAVESIILAVTGLAIAVGLFFAWRHENEHVFSIDTWKVAAGTN